MQLMSIEDLSVYLGDSKRTIYKYIASGDCPPYMRISGKNIKFDRADVDAWLESKKVASPSAPLCLSEEILPWAPRALRVTKLAENKARKCGLDYVGTEHLLTAIMHEPECIAAIILKNVNVDSGRFQKLYENLCPADFTPPGAASHGGTDSKTLLDTARMAIRCAADESRRCGHKYIGTEHLLPGILLITGGLGYRILAELGVDLQKVRQERDKLLVCHPENAEGTT
jgi:excisionase family DNA binding protein